ncbi:helix-turn-helix domain-containing protein [Janthinobacterium sp. PSPC3-1]|uniref:helix-turn-helix domain-containing protein n=1 Tax=Janthinobacterium sp. PSPC3-1 TaxID=2804653 RepID=UPI003CE9F67D
MSLERNGYNVSRAARDLGISRTTAYRLLERGDDRRTSSTGAAHSAVANTLSDACGIGSEH